MNIRKKLLFAPFLLSFLVLAGCPSPFQTLTGVSLDQSTLTLSAGGVPGVLKVTFTPATGTNKNVTWSSSDATVATVSDAGIVTPLKVGTTTVTVTTEDGSLTASAVVTVTAAQVVGVFLDKATLTVAMGGTATLTPTVVPAYAANTAVSWLSSNTSVATVAGGVITPVAVGQATITVTTSDGAKTAVCIVSVTLAVTGVTVSPANLDLNVGGSTYTLVTTFAPTNATDKGVTWSSSNTGVATVSAAGVVTPVAQGTATITATTTSGGKTGTASVTVHPAPITVYNTISTFAGTGATGLNGDGSAASNATFTSPLGIAGDVAGNIYIADSGNAVIRKIAAGSGIISTFAGTGTPGYTGNGAAAVSATLSGNIGGLFVNASGDLFIADTGNNAIRRVDHSSGFISTVAGTGVSGDDPSATPVASARLSSPTGVCVDVLGDIFIADQGSSLVKEVLAGNMYNVAGIVGNTSTDAADGTLAANTAIGTVYDVRLDGVGNLYIAAAAYDGNYHPRIRKVALSSGTNGPGIVINGTLSTVVGSSAISGFSGDGAAATAAQLGLGLRSFAVTSSGAIYVADTYNHVVRMVDTGGTINTVAGTGTSLGFVNGAILGSKLNSPAGVFVDINGVIYISDTSNNVIRKVN